jgi:hypothetical protein
LSLTSRRIGIKTCSDRKTYSIFRVDRGTFSES